MKKGILSAVFAALFISGLIILPTAFAQDQAQSVVVEKKPGENPIIDIPVGAGRFLYGGFQGFGQMFDGFITGYKAPEKFGEPGPITQFQDRYGELQQMDYGEPPLQDFAMTASEEHEISQGWDPDQEE